jgi:exodeoxyribonuclease VIII
MIRTDISSESYHLGSELSRSRAWDLLKLTPMHVKHSIDHPPPSTPALLMGGCFHSAVLEPDKLEYEYGELPNEIDGKSPATKHYKEKMSEMKFNYPERRWLNAKDFNTCMEMAASALENPVLSEYMSDMDAIIEGTGYFSMAGAECRVRPDYFLPGAEVVIDLKSTMDASEKGFEKSVRQFGYAFQACFYMEGLRRMGYDVNEFIFVAVEKRPPYATAAYRLPIAEITKYLEDMTSSCRLWSKCVSSKVWPGYDPQVVTLDINNYYNQKSIADIARMFNVSRTYVYKLVNTYQLETRRMGNKNMLEPKEFQRALVRENKSKRAA